MPIETKTFDFVSRLRKVRMELEEKRKVSMELERWVERSNTERVAWDGIFYGEVFYIMFPDDSTITYRYHPMKTVGMLQSTIFQDTGLPLERMSLYFPYSEGPLDIGLGLPEAGIRPDSSVLIAML